MTLKFMEVDATATEDVHVVLKLDKTRAEKYKKEIKTISFLDPPVVGDDDTLHLTYDLYIMYFGEIRKHLKALKRICGDSKVVVGASCEALESGRILAYEALRALDDVIELVRNRNNVGN